MTPAGTRCGSVAVVVVAFFGDGCGADDVVSCGFASRGLDGASQGQALSLCQLADGDEVVGLGPVADGLLHDGARASSCATMTLEAGAFRGGAGFALGSVVAKPNGG